MKLWAHQLQAVEVCGSAHARPRSRVLLQFPTASGKTELAIRVGLAYLGRPFARVLFVVPTAQILEQFVSRLAQRTAHRISIEKADRRAPSGARLVVASQNSLWDRLPLYDPATLCIYDECHHANLDAEHNLRIAESFNHVVGLSATPWSRGCDTLFADAAKIVLPLTTAQHLGVVAPLAIEPWTEPHGPHGLVFCGTNAEAAARSAAQPGSAWVGVNSGRVEARVEAWRRGAVPVLFANRMLGEGFDEPRCDRVWVAVESESDIRLVQMAGRSLRARAGKVARIHCLTPAISERMRRALARADIAPHIAG